LAEALAETRFIPERTNLAEALAAVAKQLPAVEGARMLTEALGKDECVCPELARGLAAVAGCLPPADAAHLLAEALERAKDARVIEWLAQSLAAVAGRLPPAEAVQVCGPVAHRLAEALGKEPNAWPRRLLAGGLAAVAGRLPPAEAVHLLAEALGNETNAWACSILAEGLVRVTDGLDSAEADRVCSQALGVVQQHEVSAAHTNERIEFKRAAAWLVQSLVDEKARAIATQQARQTAATYLGDNWGVYPWVDDFDRLLTEASPPHRSRRASVTATAISLACGGPLPALSALPAAGEPLPCRLSTAELVELLKYPTCYGAARQVVLKHLGNRYGRSFATHWEFVRFAQQQGLGLDFTSPPKRPRENAPIGRP
jgi:hypothetical protein